ncbi:MAG: hypothetical protein A3K30_04430 [Deltaproteobacteria bacterium RBG_13_51_10]|nr:MAG: hypothetical protein A3K30_04430 [Deltaproteobacteria bacterium RBG_13_51_10]
MKKYSLRLFLICVVGLFALMSMPNAAVSYTIQNIGPFGTYNFPNSGDYLGTVMAQNDSISVVEGVLEQLRPTIDYVLTEVGMFVKYDPAGTMSGEWATFNPVSSTIPAGALAVDFYVVKGGPDFALYEEIPPSPYGTWNVENLLNPGGQSPALSHFSGYSAGEGTNGKVPEPTTLLLLGFGLAGAIPFVRRRLQK